VRRTIAYVGLPALNVNSNVALQYTVKGTPSGGPPARAAAPDGKTLAKILRAAQRRHAP
jgi:hypothetical protein